MSSGGASAHVDALTPGQTTMCDVLVPGLALRDVTPMTASYWARRLGSSGPLLVQRWWEEVEEEGTLAVAAAAAVVVVSLLAQERPFTLYIKLAVTSVHSTFVISQNFRLPCCLLHSIAERAAVLMLTSLCTTRKL